MILYLRSRSGLAGKNKKMNKKAVKRIRKRIFNKKSLIFKPYFFCFITIFMLTAFLFVVGLPQLGADPGPNEGALILLWNGTSTPAGWSNLSDPGGTFYNRLPVGAATFGAISGTLTHTHTLTYVSCSNTNPTTAATKTGTGATGAAINHAHESLDSSTQTAGSNLPRYENLSFIIYNAGIPVTIPQGAIAIFNVSAANLPDGWKQFNASINQFIMGSSVTADQQNLGGGAHTHTITVTTGAPNLTEEGSSGTPAGDCASTTHTHTSGATASASVYAIPQYINVTLAYATTDIPLEEMAHSGFIGMFNFSTLASGWVSMSGVGEDFNGKYFMSSDTGYGDTGGAANSDHTHSNLGILLPASASTGTGKAASPVANAISSHVHDTFTVSFNTSSATPPSVGTVFGYLQTATDTIKPEITINSPTNKTYNNASLDYNVSLNEDGSWCGFSHEGSSNITMTELTTTTFGYTNSSLSDGHFNITFYCNDTSNHYNKTSIAYTRDATPPYFTKTENQTIYTNQSAMLDIDATDNLGFHNYSVNDTTLFSINGTGGLVNISALSVKFYWLNITINDTANNINSTIIYVNVSAEPTPVILEWSNNQINYSDVFSGYYVNHSADWTTSSGTLSYWIFSWNGSNCGDGTWTNSTSRAFGSASSSNVSLIPTNCNGKNIGWKIIANNSFNNWNVTAEGTYFVNFYGSFEINYTIGSEINGSCTEANPCEWNNFTNKVANVTITCVGGTGAKCGTVSAGIRHNASGPTPDTFISTTEYAEPMYILGGDSTGTDAFWRPIYWTTAGVTYNPELAVDYRYNDSSTKSQAGNYETLGIINYTFNISDGIDEGTLFVNHAGFQIGTQIEIYNWSSEQLEVWLSPVNQIPPSINHTVISKNNGYMSQNGEVILSLNNSIQGGAEGGILVYDTYIITDGSTYDYWGISQSNSLGVRNVTINDSDFSSRWGSLGEELPNYGYLNINQSDDLYFNFTTNVWAHRFNFKINNTPEDIEKIIIVLEGYQINHTEDKEINFRFWNGTEYTTFYEMTDLSDSNQQRQFEFDGANISNLDGWFHIQAYTLWSDLRLDYIKLNVISSSATANPNSFGILDNGDSVQVNFTINMTNNASTNVLDFFVNSSYGNINVPNNSTVDAYFGVGEAEPEIPLTLNVEITLKDPMNDTWANSSLINFTFIPLGTDNLNATYNATLYMASNLGSDFQANGTVNDVTNATLGVITLSDFLEDGDYRYYINVTNGTATNQSATRTLHVDTIIPFINFTAPTPNNASSTSNNWIYVNTSLNDDRTPQNISAFIDFNKSLVAWYRFEEASGSTAYDSSGNDNNGTLVSMNTGLDNNSISGWTSSGRYGKALKFDSVNDYVNCGNGSSLNINGTQLTIEMWAKLSSFDTHMSLVGKGVYDSNMFWWLTLFYGAPSRIDMGLGDSTQRSYLQEQWEPDLNRWYHITFVFNNSDGDIYINGDHLGETHTYPFSSFSSGVADVWIGSEESEGREFNGTIDEVRIWKRALSPEEINASYNAGVYKLYRNFTNLSYGDYGVKAYVVDSAGNINTTLNRTITLAEAVGCGCNNGTYNYSCGENITTNCDMNCDILDYGGDYCFNVSASNLVIDGNGYTIDGTNVASSIAFDLMDGFTNTTIHGFEISEFGWGVFGSNFDHLPTLIYDINLTYIAMAGIDVWAGNLTSYNVNCTHLAGHCFEVDSDDNRIYNSTAKNVSYFVDTNECGDSGSLFDELDWCVKVYNNTAENITKFADMWKSEDAYYNNIIHCSGDGNAFVFSDDDGYEERDVAVYNNLINCTNYADISIHTHANSDVFWNMTNATGQRIDHPGNEPAAIGGNYYTNRTGNGFSDDCADTDANGYCDDTFSPDGEDTDYLPYSDGYGTTQAPTVPWVQKINDVDLTGGGISTIWIAFNVTDTNGYDNIDHDMTNITVHLGGGDTNRTNVSCGTIMNTTDTTVFNCSIDMWFYDTSGTWNITVLTQDDGGLNAYNITQNFTVNDLHRVDQDTTTITWTEIYSLSADNEADNYMNLTNLGNQNYSIINFTAIQCTGAVHSNKIYAENFSVYNVTGATTLQLYMVNNTGVYNESHFPDLNRHGLGINETIYFYVDSPVVLADTYSTDESWSIEVQTGAT